MTRSVVIVGAGAAGLAAAWSARREGRDVTVIVGSAGASSFGGGAVDDVPWERLVVSIRAVLGEAIHQAGTTLRDSVSADGTPGYFRQQLFVYERYGEACRRCATPIRHLVQGQRSTYFCPTCQK